MVWMPPNIPEALQPKLNKLLGDRELFCRMLPVYDKTRHQLVKFNALPAQRKVWLNLDAHDRLIIVKARQMGVSYAVRAWQFHRAYCATEPAKYAVLSFHDRSARNLRQIDRQWLQALPEALQRSLSVDSATDSVYADTGAGISAWTTGGRGGTRSFSFSAAHLSEFAFYADPDEVLAQVLATVGDGPVVIESTVNAPGDAFHRLVQGAPENGWKVLFLPWFEHEAYFSDPPEDFEPTVEESLLAAQHGLSDGQLYWRRMQVASLGPHKFRREYPSTLDECFLGVTSNAYLDSEILSNIEMVHFNTPKRVLEEPNPEDYYVIGADPAGGTGGDYSALVVLSANTYQPVYIERDNTIAPHEFAHRIVEVAAKYTTLHGQPIVLCESNNHGHAVLRELDHLGYNMRWRDHNNKPWLTTHKSKIDAFDALRELLQSSIIDRLDQTTLMELRSLQIVKVSPEAPPGLHDDCAVALALAVRCLRDVPASKRRQTMNGRMDAMMARSRARKIKSKRLPWSTNR